MWYKKKNIKKLYSQISKSYWIWCVWFWHYCSFRKAKETCQISTKFWPYPFIQWWTRKFYLIFLFVGIQKITEKLFGFRPFFAWLCYVRIFGIATSCCLNTSKRQLQQHQPHKQPQKQQQDPPDHRIYGVPITFRWIIKNADTFFCILNRQNTLEKHIW